MVSHSCKSINSAVEFSRVLILDSLSEYGCNKNTREFNEVAALYGSNMTPVYSGGLVYEYSQEEANYGLVTISGGSVQELADFGTLKDKFAATPLPSGDGGYNAQGAVSQCPPKSDSWVVDDTTGNYLPIMPEGAQKYMTSGAGKAPGNSGSTGSQTAGTPSTGFAMSDGSAPPSNNGGSTTSSAAANANVRIPELTLAPFVVGFVVIASSMMGGASLFL